MHRISTPQDSVAQVEHALVRMQAAIAHVERLIVDEQADDLAVGDVQDRLAGFGVAVACFGIGERAQLVERVQVRAGDPVGLADRSHLQAVGHDNSGEAELAAQQGGLGAPGQRRRQITGQFRHPQVTRHDGERPGGDAPGSRSRLPAMPSPLRGIAARPASWRIGPAGCR